MNETVFNAMTRILDSYQSMDQQEMKQALFSLIHATKMDAIEKVKSAIYHIENI